MSGIGTVATSDPGGGLRRALLARIAWDLRALTVSPLWGCCWVYFERPSPSGRIEHFVHQICDQDCDHWHHTREVWYA